MNPASGLIASPVASPYDESKKIFVMWMTKRGIIIYLAEMLLLNACCVTCALGNSTELI